MFSYRFKIKLNNWEYQKMINIFTHNLEGNRLQIDNILYYLQNSCFKYMILFKRVYCWIYTEHLECFRKQTRMNIIVMNMKNNIGVFTVSQFNTGKQFVFSNIIL